MTVYAWVTQPWGLVDTNGSAWWQSIQCIRTRTYVNIKQYIISVHTDICIYIYTHEIRSVQINSHICNSHTYKYILAPRLITTLGCVWTWGIPPKMIQISLFLCMYNDDQPWDSFHDTSLWFISNSPHMKACHGCYRLCVLHISRILTRYLGGANVHMRLIYPP
jgi:hypothetical protein